MVGAANSAAGAFLFGAGAEDQAVTADADASIVEHTCFLLLDARIFVIQMFLVLDRLYHPR